MFFFFLANIHTAMATKKKSSAKCTKAFLGEKSQNSPYFDNEFLEVRLPAKTNRVLKKIQLCRLTFSQICLIPLVDDHNPSHILDKIGKERKKPTLLLISKHFSCNPLPILSLPSNQVTLLHTYIYTYIMQTGVVYQLVMNEIDRNLNTYREIYEILNCRGNCSSLGFLLRAFKDHIEQQHCTLPLSGRE